MDKTDIFEMDFSEVEIRVLAHMRQDAEKMDATDRYRRPKDLSGFDTAKVRCLLSLKDAEAILKGKGVVKCPDIHKNRAAEMFGIEVDKVTDEQRRFAKSHNFVELYSQPSGFIDGLVDVALENARKRLNES